MSTQSISGDSGANPIDRYFAAAAQGGPSSKLKLTKQVELPEAGNWLTDQKRFVQLTNYPQIENFVMQLFDPTSILPEASQIATVVDSSFESHYPKTSSSSTNPATEAYQVFETKIRALARDQGWSINYSSSAQFANFRDKRQVAVLIPDIHNDSKLRLNNFRILRELFANRELALSTGLSEGGGDVAAILKTMPIGLDVDRLEQAVLKFALMPEQALMYCLQNDNTAVNYARFVPEQLRISEEMEAFVVGFIPLAAGVFNHAPGAQKDQMAESAAFLAKRLYTLKIAFKEVGIDHEFYALFGSKLNKVLGEMDFLDIPTKKILLEAQ